MFFVESLSPIAMPALLHKNRLWFWLQISAFAAAFLESLFLPSAQDIKEYVYRTVLVIIIAVFLALRVAALKFSALTERLNYKACFGFACAIVLILWDVLSVKTAILPVPYFPSMADILYKMFDDRILLLTSTLYSMRLFFAGLITGTALGLATGILIGWFKSWDYWLSPIIRISGIVPAVAWLPIALLLLPNAFTTGLFLIFMSSWFPVSSMMAQGISSTPKAYFEAAKTLGASNRFLLFRVAVPHAMPAMFTGIMTATAFSFTTLIVSEMVGAKAGLGFYINWAKGWGAYAKVYGAIIIIANEFAIILSLIGKLRKYVLRWQSGVLK